MSAFEELPLLLNLAIFAAATAVIAYCGFQLARAGDRLADLTGLGEAVTGGLFLGASTSLPGIVGTAFAAHAGHADFAASHAFGGIAIQTAFLAVVDLFYRRANLEHAAASIPNLVQCMVLVGLLAAILFAAMAPDIAFAALHPVSVLLPVGYLFGIRLAQRAQERPMWRPVRTPDTREDHPKPQATASVGRVAARFALLAAATAAGGYLLVGAAVAIANSTGLSESLVGGVFTTLSSSLPELVTAFAAVRIGAPTLAVGNIIGGNAFDCLFLPIGDLAYRSGTIYHALSTQTLALLGLALIQSSILATGLVSRQRRGPAGIGFESALMLACYLVGVAWIYML